MHSLRPLFDMHVHLRGTLQPRAARMLAAANNISLPSKIFNEHGEYQFENFEDFLHVYNCAGLTIRSKKALKQVAKAYLRSASKLGAIYIEFMISPSHSIANGISWREQIEAIAEASSEFDGTVSTTIIATAVRHHGPDEAVSVARMVASTPHELVGGFGLTGKEDSFPARLFAGAFKIASDAGLGLTAHAGEWCNARTILDTVDQLKVSRIGHGLSAASDPGVLRELVDRGIGFEVCQSANTALRSLPSNSTHPLQHFAAGGASLLIGTDDPAFFRTTIAKEYDLASKALTSIQMDSMTDAALRLAFCNDPVRAKLRQRYEGLCNKNAV